MQSNLLSSYVQIICLLICNLSIQFTASSQKPDYKREINFDLVFPNDDISNVKRSSYVFDKENILWFTNNNQGLYEYDGERTIYHSFKDIWSVKLKHESVHEIFRLDNGLFITFSDSKILVIDLENDHITELKSPFPSSETTSKQIFYYSLLTIDSNSVLIFSNKFKGITKTVKGTEETKLYTNPFDSVLMSSFNEYQITRIIKGLHGKYFGAGKGGFISFTLNEESAENILFTPIPTDKSLDPWVHSLALGKTDEIWALIGCKSNHKTQFYRYSLSTNEFDSFPDYSTRLYEPDLYSHFDHILLDSNDILWITTWRRNILKYKLKREGDSIQINKASYLSTNAKYPAKNYSSYVKDIFLDRTGGFWISSVNAILKYHDSKEYFSLNYLQSKHRNLINEISVNEKKDAYNILTTSNYLEFEPNEKYEDRGTPHLSLKNIKKLHNENPTIKFNQLFHSSDSSFAFTTTKPNGIYSYNPITDKLDDFLERILDDSEQVIFTDMDNNGQTWAIVHQESIGYKMLWIDPFTQNYKWIIDKDLLLDDFRIMKFAGDDKLFIIIGPGDRFVECKIKRNGTLVEGFDYVKIHQFSEKLFNIGVYTKNELLFSTMGGDLIKWNINNQQIDSSFNFKFSAPVTEMYYESDSTIWLKNESNNLLYYCNTSNGKCKEANSFFGTNLLPRNYTGKISMGINGRSIIPGAGYYYEFERSNQNSKYKARPFTNQVIIVNDRDSISNINHTKFNINEKLVLPHNIKKITFNYSALHYKDQDQNTYSYKLKGLDKSWSKISLMSSTNYSYPPPGEYTFQLKAANSDGIWSDEIAELKFRILAPWYWSWWSKSLYSLLSIGLLYMIYLFSQRRRDEKSESLKIKQMDQLRTKLYTNITHEFRTPLTVIQGMAEDVFDNLPKTQQQRFGNKLQMILRNGDNLLGLVNQMLDLDKLEAGKFVLQYEQADIIPYIHYLTDSFISMAQLKDIQITFYSEVEALIMDFDPDNLRKIIFNLMSNAIKFTPKDGSVICHVTRIEDESDSCIIKIKDSGIGIPESELPKIFDRFHRVLADGEDPGTGSGIGLALTKDLVELMNGRINVQSSPGKGTEFTLKLPIIKNAQISKTEFPESIRTLDRELKNEFLPEELALELLPTALIVEDNRDVAAYVALCLRRRYNVIHAVDGKDGVNKAYKEIPDIIISDVMMPKMNGFKLVETLKKDDRTSHIPIILLTAKSSIEDKLSGLKYGADTFLIKPFNKEELIIRMEQLIELRNKLWKKYSVLNRKGNSLEQTDDPQDKFITKTVKFVENNLDDPDYGAESLAKDLNLSVSQSYRKIKFITGKSTAIFIRWVRLQHSLEMLENTDKNISEISHSCGFKDPSWFSRAFKEEFGYPPSSVVK